MIFEIFKIKKFSSHAINLRADKGERETEVFIFMKYFDVRTRAKKERRRGSKIWEID